MVIGTRNARLGPGVQRRRWARIPAEAGTQEKVRRAPRGPGFAGDGLRRRLVASASDYRNEPTKCRSLAKWSAFSASSADDGVSMSSTDRRPAADGTGPGPLRDLRRDLLTRNPSR